MISLTDYGYSDFFEAQTAFEEYVPARVTAVHRERYEAVCEHGAVSARLKSAVYFYGGGEEFPTTGDFVLLGINGQDDATIVKTLSRRTLFSRRDPTPGRGEQAVAANFDYVFILQSLNHDFNPKRLERYLTLAWQSGAMPVVALTKADLAADYAAQVHAAEDMSPGVAVAAVSSVTGHGLEQLGSFLQPGKTLVFLGSSGVGKSSLINALAGSEVMRVGEIREDDSRGRHTTTHRQLLLLPTGVIVIDTPGMRELGMWDVTEGLGETFHDVETHLGNCRFSDCGHKTEPGCAIRAAIERGELTTERWESYQKLKREAKFADDKQAAMREREAFGKKNARFNRQRKREF